MRYLVNLHLALKHSLVAKTAKILNSKPFFKFPKDPAWISKFPKQLKYMPVPCKYLRKTSELITYNGPFIGS